MELIRVRESNCQSTDFSKKLFLFLNGKLPFLRCSGDDVSWIPPNQSLVRMILGSVLLVCWLIFHSVSFLLLKKKNQL